MALKKLFIIFGCLVAASAFAQQDFSKVQIETIPVAKVIPGHGPLGNKADLKAYRDMLATVQGRMAKLIKEGKNIDEIIAAKPTADYDEKWGRGFLKPDRWVQVVYSVMQK